MNIFGKSERQKAEIGRQEKLLEALEAEIHSVVYWRSDEVSMAELVISIERYAGKRAPWYLDPQLSEVRGGAGIPVFLDENYHTWVIRSRFWSSPPDIGNYRVVTYWEAYVRSDGDTKEFNEIKEESETERFIRDRLDWAEVQLLKMIGEMRESLEALKDTKMEWGMEEV